MIKKLLFFCSIPFLINAQSNLSNFSFGIQYKPIIPVAYFNAGDEGLSWEDNNITLSPRLGQSLGMIIRYQFTNTFSLETGLNMVNRRYRLSLVNPAISFQDQSTFNIRSYEWPIQLLSYVRVSEKYYLNASFGNAINIFPADVISYGESFDFFFVSTSRRRKIQSAFVANFGLEYRTENSGFFYIGASLHRPWKNSARSFPEYNYDNNSFNTEAPSDKNAKYLDISGNYFTIDFRYFFVDKN